MEQQFVLLLQGVLEYAKNSSVVVYWDGNTGG